MGCTGEREISAAELAMHKEEKCSWVAFYGTVYDVSSFVAFHPGGKKVILDLAGKDGTESFQAIHPKSMLERLPPGCRVGHLNPTEQRKAQTGIEEPLTLMLPPAGVDCFASIKSYFNKFMESRACASSASSKKSEEKKGLKFESLDDIINIYDFEMAAQEKMAKTGYDYYASAACDEVTKRANCDVFSRVWLRPRIMVDVSNVNTSTCLLGSHSSFPLFFSPAAMAGMAHADGECALARAAGKFGIVQCIANMATRDFEDIVAERVPGQTQWYQICINPDRQRSEAMLQRVLAAGVTTLFVTVDCNVVGRRERDQRNKLKDKSAVAKEQRTEATTAGGVIGALGNFTDASWNWKDLAWLRQVTHGKMKILLKGVQTGEDAVLAAQHGLDGILVSNHGGRQLDHVRPTLHALAEITATLEEAGLSDKLEVFLDGGIRRGTDIYKALALGAKAVGIGRPALFSLAYGQAGIDKCVQILKDEFTNCMQLMGKTSVSQISRSDIVCEFPTTAVNADARSE
eukprot:CAMPEP_0206503854 /NCGR_PEP_ID=MMETSP0324_2-20121206/55049_1 /ASSEMBLY_ACC=CAM_ASM_000836 /TAXON_ID=2866 /ORGANISM="Crypthecodinium cohnii, Strain Seligo" /LENGTH=516 /DNA_ID=CAMNT_0053992735 /DNA_START=160 /DNA_END=1711 /DNA_ORIENTATION=+